MKSTIIDDGARWSLSTRIAVRFGALYWLCYIFPFPISDWWPESFTKAYYAAWTAGARWVATSVLGVFYVDYPGPNGSGDTTLDYVAVFAYAVLAAGGTLIWFALEHRRAAYPVVHGWLRIALRYYLAAMMFSYGSIKVIKLQFPAPDPSRLAEPYGDSSPMGLLWTLMGSSQGYTFIAGAAEILGGVLLLFRRTTTLGALVLIGVMGNVVALNFCYDVPVKQFSSHLLLAALILVVPDVRRLVAFFVQNRVVEPARLDPPFTSRRWLRVAAVVKVAVIGWWAYSLTADALKDFHERGDHVAPWPLAGVYEVDACDAWCPDWRQVALGSYKGGPRLLIQRTNGEMRRYGTKIVGDALTLTSHPYYWNRSPVIEQQLRLTYQVEADGTLVLRGYWHGHPFVMRLRKVDRRFLLVERGFHWINEYPLNL